jgi:hypothetical protein
MRTPVFVGALAAAAFIAGVVYLKHDPAPQPATTQSAPGAHPVAEPVMPAARSPQSSVPGGTSSGPRSTDSKQVPSDPRLAAMQSSPDNGLIEFVRGAEGKVIAELDKDPGSPSFKKPLREYVYSGDKVVAVTSYRYLPDHVEIQRTSVSYKPDGSIDRYAQSTSFDSAKKEKPTQR